MHASDYPMPAHYPHFPHRSLVQQYLEQYAEHHNLAAHIELQCRIQSIQQVGVDVSVTAAAALVAADKRSRRDLALHCDASEPVANGQHALGWVVHVHQDKCARTHDDDSGTGSTGPGPAILPMPPSHDSSSRNASASADSTLRYLWFSHVVVASGQHQHPNIPEQEVRRRLLVASLLGLLPMVDIVAVAVLQL